jgi:hypothetical protein
LREIQGLEIGIQERVTDKLFMIHSLLDELIVYSSKYI